MGERWECLKFKTSCDRIIEIEGGDFESKSILISPMNFGIVQKLGEMGWKMTGVTAAEYSPFANGFFFFAREIR